MIKFKRLLIENRSTLNALFRGQRDKLSIQSDLKVFYNVVLRQAARSFRRKGIKNSPTTSWWTPGIRARRSKVKALFRRLRKDQHDASLRERYSREFARYKRDVAKRKRQFWLDMCESTHDRFGFTFKLAHGKFLLPEHLVHTVIHSSGIGDSRSDVFRQLIAFKLGGSVDPVGSLEPTSPPQVIFYGC